MSPRRLITLVPIVAAAIALSLYGSGCGATSATLDPVAQAAEVTSHVGGAHLAVSIEASGSGLSQPFVIGGQGFFNYRTQEGTLSLDATSLPANVAAILPSGPLHIEEIFKSSTIYLGSPLLAGRLPSGARWIKLDIGRFAQAIGFDLGQLSGGQSNPALFLQYIKAIAGTPEPVGRELVRAVATTHYRAAIDLGKVAGVLSPDSSGQLRVALAKLTAQLGTSTLPVDVWVDDQHLVRRIQIALAPAAAAPAPRVSVTLELFEFGPTPSLKAPAQNEVFDATQAALSGLGAAGG
jgi:hypothetical protein